ncbi:hypothetical protein HY637_02585 [Candidatus Woesearchaeota archaeon]|nr:hypothetical protein [Candidatus Woesearchaeota archaeon]
MRRSILILLVIFLMFFPYIVSSVSTFVIQETEKLKVEPRAFDPDNDKLDVSYAPPLDDNGEWQTTYGDAGTYDTEIIVSDGQASVSEYVQITVKRKEEQPTIDLRAPEDPVSIEEGKSVFFNVSASDLNNDELSYKWFVDGQEKADGQGFTYSTGFGDAGTHKVEIKVSDGLYVVGMAWRVIVHDFNVQGLLDSIPDAQVDEGEKIILKLPDFESYGIDYSISEPVGNDNEWQTGFDDAGSYNVMINAQGSGFKGSADVEVVVNNVDRPPVFEKIDNVVVNEGQEAAIVLKATDADGDEVVYSAKSMPEGAKLEANKFTWAPGFDTVKKDNFVDYMIDKLKALNKNFYVQFVASSNDKSVVNNVVITVRDVNRAPVVEDFSPINVREGDTIRILPNAYDLDGDSIKITYSGFMTSDTYATDFDDAGAYEVKVTANDGSLETTKIAQIVINNTNRAPVFEKVPDRKVKEGEEVVILLDSYDPDGDSLRYSIENPPENYALEGNVFTWTPSYSTAARGELKNLEIIFVVGDGRLAAKQIAVIQVEDRNRAPKIINGTSTVFADANVPVFMFVSAMDPDGDALSYVWDFGLFEKYVASDKHQRTFSTPGEKQVKVTVSDGIEKAEHGISVFIKQNASAIPYLNETYTSTRKFNITVKKETRISEKSVTSGALNSKNTPPRIVDSSDYVVARLNQPVLLFVKAVDDNGDKLAYTWDFGFLDKHDGNAYHQRTFTSKGTKTIKVTVSDGTYLVEHIITVTVV